MNSFILKKAVKVHGMESLVKTYIQPHHSRLPSTNQWYRLRESVATGDIEKIKRFLEERSSKLKVKQDWEVHVTRKESLWEWLLHTLIEPVEKAPFPGSCQADGWKVHMDLPVGVERKYIDQSRIAVLQKVLETFIDHVLMLSSS